MSRPPASQTIRCLDCYHLRTNPPTPGWVRCRKQQWRGLLELEDTRLLADLQCHLFDGEDDEEVEVEEKEVKERKASTIWDILPMYIPPQESEDG